jgi:hypothetical protein
MSMGAHKVNIKNLKWLRTFLAEQVNHEQFHIGTFFSGVRQRHNQNYINSWNGKAFPCGSTACVIGHACLNPELNPLKLAPRKFVAQVLGAKESGCIWDFLFSGEWSVDSNSNDIPPQKQWVSAIARLDEAIELLPTMDYNRMKEVAEHAFHQRSSLTAAIEDIDSCQ